VTRAANRLGLWKVDNLYILGKSFLANPRKLMDFNTYIIHDQDNNELIQVHTKITHANLTHVEVVQMIMIADSYACLMIGVGSLALKTLGFKVYAVYRRHD
jgi:hypothetical protein